MSYKNSPYFHLGRATELSGQDYVLYRFFEMLPGMLSWGTLAATLLVSYFAPVAAAIFIIVFDLYWLLKTFYLTFFLSRNWKRIRHNMTADWGTLLSHLKYEHLYHVVILPFYSEGIETIETSVRSLLQTETDPKRLIVVLAAEGKRGNEGHAIAKEIQEKYRAQFGHFLTTIHPEGLPGEMAGKGANISWALERARVEVLDAKEIPYEDVLVSAFDIDTVVYKHYFQCVTWYFLTEEDPYHASYQPVPFYNNNIWDAPALSRVVAGSGTFWQMIQQERPERNVTFSSHTVPFKTLYEIGYWQKNMVSEDSRIFWNAFFAYEGKYRTISISYPVSMDANLAPTLWETLKNIYKQQRRWAWGAENVPYLLFGFIKDKKIPLGKKIRVAFVQIEGYWSLATNPIFIFLLGWLPLVLGGKAFNSTVLSYNLPLITRNLMVIAMIGLLICALVFLSFLPQVTVKTRKRDRALMFLQWIFVPVTIIIFGAIPGLDAQTRLMIGKYMGFWVTPKFSKGN
jgi:hypothetical protein